jgi:hypothetical protein
MALLLFRIVAVAVAAFDTGHSSGSLDRVGPAVNDDWI